MSAEVAASFDQPAPEPDWADLDAVVEYIVAGDRVFAGTLPVDEDRSRALVARVYDRTTDMAASMTNHWLLEPGPPLCKHLGKISAPTLSCCTARPTRCSLTATARRSPSRSGTPGSSP